MQKTAGASCPRCAATYCAEYAQMGKPARWTCNGCGAEGDLLGDFSHGKRAPAPASTAGQPKPHWNDQRRAKG